MSVEVEKGTIPNISRREAIQMLLELLIQEPEPSNTQEEKEAFADYPEMLTTKEVAQICHVSERFAQDFWLKEDFPGLRFGVKKVVLKEDLLQWIRDQKGKRNDKK